ncbi:hypothetical protein BXZ70DRAFT_979564, partial [Cristinia sonorae]
MSTSPRTSSSSDSFHSDHSGVHAYDSSAALIVVHDNEEPEYDPTSFDFSSDDEESEEDEQYERLRSSSVPPLPATSVFLYLFSPLLKLGAIQLFDASKGVQLKWAITALVVFAALCALTRHVWHMLAKYVRRADMEAILLETFARGRGKEGLRNAIRRTVRVSVGLFRVLLAIVYLRASVDVLLPLFPHFRLIHVRAPLTVVLALCIAPLCLPRSLAGSSVLYTTWASVVTFVAWLISMAYAHAKGIRTTNPTSESLGILWQGISIFAFAFATTNTLPLYAALKGSLLPGQPKPRRTRRFTLLSLMSIGLAALLILPLVFFGQPSQPDTRYRKPTFTFRTVLAFFHASTLALSIPSIIITTPELPLPLSIRRSATFQVSKVLLYTIIVSVSLVPVEILRVLSDVVFVLAFVSTYMLPGLIHIVIHTFRRPLAIVIPPSTPITPSSSQASNPYPPESRTDELLQRKERLLQRKRLGKRLVWDIGVWVLLLPVGGGGLLWCVGRIAGKW